MRRSLCTEYTLSHLLRDAYFPVLHGHEVLWVDDRHRQPDGPHCNDIYGYDLRSWQASRLTSGPYCYRTLEYDGRHVLFQEDNEPYSDWRTPQHLVLWDRRLDTQIEVAGGAYP